MIVSKKQKIISQSDPLEERIADYAKAMAGDNATMEAVKEYFTKPLINPITRSFLFLLSKNSAV